MFVGNQITNIQRIHMSVSLRSNQALQASTLVGRSVYVPSSYMEFTNNDVVNVLLSLDVDSPNVVLYLEDTAGETWQIQD